MLASVFTAHGGYSTTHAFIGGFTAALWVGSALSAGGVLAALLIPVKRTHLQLAPDLNREPALAEQHA